MGSPSSVVVVAEPIATRERAFGVFPLSAAVLTLRSSSTKAVKKCRVFKRTHAHIHLYNIIYIHCFLTWRERERERERESTTTTTMVAAAHFQATTPHCSCRPPPVWPCRCWGHCYYAIWKRERRKKRPSIHPSIHPSDNQSLSSIAEHSSSWSWSWSVLSTRAVFQTTLALCAPPCVHVRMSVCLSRRKESGQKKKGAQLLCQCAARGRLSPCQQRSATSAPRSSSAALLAGRASPPPPVRRGGRVAEEEAQRQRKRRSGRGRGSDKISKENTKEKHTHEKKKRTKEGKRQPATAAAALVRLPAS